MKRIETPKRMFTFTVGEDPEVMGIDRLADFPHLNSVYQNWLTAEMTYERDWRNHELSETDYMMVSDATYGGESIHGSTMIDDIIKYRGELRDYDLKENDRPIRPAWYKY